MITGTSATAKSVRLERSEIEALIDWHQEREAHCAARQDYRDAEEHRARAENLREEIAAKDHTRWLCKPCRDAHEQNVSGEVK